MENQLACNINFFLYTRFVIGLYHHFQICKPLRWLAKLYCCLVYANVVYFLYHFQLSFNYPSHLTYFLTLEYFLYLLISLGNGNKYLLQYYKKTPLIDSSASSYRSMCACLAGYLLVTFFTRAFSLVKTLILHWEANKFTHLFTFLDLIAWTAVFFGRSPLLFVFTLLYTRVRMMRQTLENNNFDCRNQGKHHPQRYIQMYEAIMDGLQESDESVKLQLFVFGVFSAIYYLTSAMLMLYYIRDYSEFLTISYKMELVWFMIEVTISSSPLLLAAILADLITMDIQEILAITVERRIACKNERGRAEIQKLFEVLKSRPFKYILWRVVPLNVRSLLSFISFSLTTFIAILQIKNWSTY